MSYNYFTCFESITSNYLYKNSSVGYIFRNKKDNSMRVIKLLSKNDSLINDLSKKNYDYMSAYCKQGNGLEERYSSIEEYITSLYSVERLALCKSIDSPRIVIFGGRDFINEEVAYNVISYLVSRFKDNLCNSIVGISGDAKGADTVGFKVLTKLGIEVEHYPADWKNIEVENAVIKHNQYGAYNANAGMIRNNIMAEVCNIALGFWDGNSRGTSNMINNLRRLNKSTIIFNYKGEIIDSFCMENINDFLS